MGVIHVWGDPLAGGLGAPEGKGFTAVFSVGGAFSALHEDGSIFTWGWGVPTLAPGEVGPRFEHDRSLNVTFASSDVSSLDVINALSGFAGVGVINAPSGAMFTAVFTGESAFAALDERGSICDPHRGSTHFQTRDQLWDADLVL
jgi:hypothetical protein